MRKDLEGSGSPELKMLLWLKLMRVHVLSQLGLFQENNDNLLLSRNTLELNRQTCQGSSSAIVLVTTKIFRLYWGGFAGATRLKSIKDSERANRFLAEEKKRQF